MKIKSSEYCDECQVKDYIEHFFVTCASVKNMWREIEQLIYQEFSVNIKLTEESIIMGINNVNNIRKNTLKKINEIILIGKMTISKYKYGDRVNIIQLLNHELSIRNFVSR